MAAKANVIVSLTSIESRLSSLDIVIKSLLGQSVAPKKIILWLAKPLTNKVPPRLKTLQGDTFEVRFIDVDASHSKLIYAYSQFPNTPVVVCDDDCIYPEHWLEKLYSDYQKYPADIIANRVRKITYSSTGELEAYRNWHFEMTPATTGENFLALGVGGVIYPPGCLADEYGDSELFLKLAPYADDLWFKMMSYRKGVQTRKASDPVEYLIPIAGTQKISLRKINVRQDKNREQWLTLCDYFNVERI